jgi:hypothetical protein
MAWRDVRRPAPVSDAPKQDVEIIVVTHDTGECEVRAVLREGEEQVGVMDSGLAARG